MVVTKQAVDATFLPKFELVILGKTVVRNTDLDQSLAEQLLECSQELDQFETVLGNTMCTLDFYEGTDGITCHIIWWQLIHCNVFCFFSPASPMVQGKPVWTERSAPTPRKTSRITSEERETSACATSRWSRRFLLPCAKWAVWKVRSRHTSYRWPTMFPKAGSASLNLVPSRVYTAAVVCVTLLNRLKGDQLDSSHDLLQNYQQRPQILVGSYIKKKLQARD